MRVEGRPALTSNLQLPTAKLTATPTRVSPPPRSARWDRATAPFILRATGLGIADRTTGPDKNAPAPSCGSSRTASFNSNSAPPRSPLRKISAAQPQMRLGIGRRQRNDLLRRRYCLIDRAIRSAHVQLRQRFPDRHILRFEIARLCSAISRRWRNRCAACTLDRSPRRSRHSPDHARSRS